MDELFGLLRFGPDGWGDEIAAGTWLTIRLALATLPFGLVVGFLVALARNNKSTGYAARLTRLVAVGFTTVFRGLPELLTIFIVYFGGQILLQRLVGLFTDTYVEVSGFVAGMVALGLVFAAFSSEVFLSALRAVSVGQIESARALGLSRLQTLWTVTMPQLVRYALPGIANLWLVLLKDTSLVSVIALSDLLRMTNVVVGNTKEPFFFYLLACLIYLVMSIISSIAIQGLEAWSYRSERQVGAS
ncbi:MAG: ABC transporter permease subunit [Fimbriimonadaceae bacterium]|nr:ABC transporter permease subunit [Alphaproteobacteria bacterium]